MAGSIRRLYRLRKDTKKREAELKKLLEESKREQEAKRKAKDVNEPSSYYGGITRLSKEVAIQDEETRKDIEKLLKRKKK